MGKGRAEPSWTPLPSAVPYQHTNGNNAIGAGGVPLDFACPFFGRSVEDQRDRRAEVEGRRSAGCTGRCAAAPPRGRPASEPALAGRVLRVRDRDRAAT